MVNSTNSISTFSLQDIGQWSDKNTSKVHIPALQRGLVWRPKQIELLWDSLFRGIPIGSFVVCPYIDAQKRAGEATAEYHLLDGQQRANAIQLGFDDFDNPNNPKGALLWLDLQPDSIPPNSTRSFLFRIATPAHPWGYTRSDEEGYLGAAKIREGLTQYGIEIKAKESDDSVFKESLYIRPAPQEIQPFLATYPIPVSLLVKVFIGNSQTLPVASIVDILRPYGKLSWARNAMQALQDGTITSIKKIEEGLTIAMGTIVLALRVPDSLMATSEQEKSNEGKEDITNIEHLFQRLNRQGTRLDGEELIYSMIKAYWPEIVQGIDGLEIKLMPASRLVVLAFRTILTEENWETEKGHKIAPDQTVSSVRQLATKQEQKQLREKIIEFINGTDALSLRACCYRIDTFLGISNPHCGWGLPSFLRSSIAYDNPNIYLLLLLLARKHPSISEENSRLLTGCVTWCSWFGSTNIMDHVASLYSVLKDDLSSDGICKAVSIAHDFFIPILTKEEFCRFIWLPDKNNVQDWTWWNLIQNDDENKQAVNQLVWNSCISKLRDKKSFLLYAQRDFLNERFSDYDPARKDLWEEHNRPWDFDHILPHCYINNKKSNNTFMRFCQQWANNNGNFRAWPFEDNRSDQETMAGDKLNDVRMKQSFIIQEELSGFNQGRQVIEDAESALNFATSCRNRLIRLYREWFDSLAIEGLLEAYRQVEKNDNSAG